MKRYSTAQTLNLEPLPIIGLDYAAGQHISASPAMSTFSGLLAAGAYLITSTAPVLFRADGQDAGPGPGSIFIAAGLPMHLLIPDGTVSVYPVTDAADVFIVPLR